MAFLSTFGRCAENTGNCSPSEGGIGTMYRQTGLQYALGAVAFLSTFGRCAENTGNCSPSEGGMRRNKKPAERTRLHRFGPHSLSAVGLLGRSVVSDSDLVLVGAGMLAGQFLYVDVFEYGIIVFHSVFFENWLGTNLQQYTCLYTRKRCCRQGKTRLCRSVSHRSRSIRIPRLRSHNIPS